MRAPLSRPPSALAQGDFGEVQAIFTDVDGTLTTGTRLAASTLAALERLAAGGKKIVLVTGRTAGWGESWARTFPVAGVIVENGALYFARDRRGRLRKVYAQPKAVRRANRVRLVREVQAALRRVPGARLSGDSLYSEVDLAIDYAEEASLGPAAASVLEDTLRRRGVRAVRSSVHVNCWIGRFDKLSMVRRFLAREWGLTLRRPDPRFVYCGDSFNDAPMFGGFSHSVGVADVLDILGSLEHPPAFVTRARGGAGFEELARALR